MILPAYASQIRKKFKEQTEGRLIHTCAIYGRIGQHSISIAFFVFIYVGMSTTGMIENLLLDEGVLGKTLHNQEERRRGISL
jgi:hypothetical protein